MKRWLNGCSYKKILGIVLAIIGMIMLLIFIPAKFWLVSLAGLLVLVGILLTK